jgi:hypothetical protein
MGCATWRDGKREEAEPWGDERRAHVFHFLNSLGFGLSVALSLAVVNS